MPSEAELLRRQLARTGGEYKYILGRPLDEEMDEEYPSEFHQHLDLVTVNFLTKEIILEGGIYDLRSFIDLARELQRFMQRAHL